MPVAIGPDGFWCSQDDPRFAFHSSLNNILLEREQDHPGTNS
jgi:hypothetical protein